MCSLVGNSGEKLRSIKIFVRRNFLQHLEHLFEITPHYNSAEDSIGCCKATPWAWTRNAQLAIRLRQWFGGRCKANAFSCAEWKQ
jgi:hypothetical protein